MMKNQSEDSQAAPEPEEIVALYQPAASRDEVNQGRRPLGSFTANRCRWPCFRRANRCRHGMKIDPGIKTHRPAY